MNDFKEYWKTRSAILKNLAAEHTSGCVFVKPIPNAATDVTEGMATECSLDNAARLIQLGSHRIANEAEIDDFKEHGQTQLRASDAAENRRDNRFALKLSLQVDQPRPATSRKTKE
jgi:hypothetical protein